jgi:hypothetical protein
MVTVNADEAMEKCEASLSSSSLSLIVIECAPSDSGLAGVSEYVVSPASSLAAAGAKHLERLPNLKIVCTAGTQLSHFNGVKVVHSRDTQSWLGIKARNEWSSKGWDLVAE